MSHFLRSQYHRVKWNGKTTGLSEPFWERPLSSELSVILTRRCHLQNGDFLGSCLLKGKNSVKRHRPVLCSKSFIEQKWKYTPETVWEGTVRKTEVAMQWSRAGFLEWCSLPMSCVIWLTSWWTALGYITFLLMCRQLTMSTQAKSMEWEGRQKPQCYFYKYGIVNPGLH